MFEKRERSRNDSSSLSTVASADKNHTQQPVSPPRRSNTASTLTKTSPKMGVLYRADTNASRTSGTRPPLVRVPTTQTRYMEMLLHLDRIPRIHNIAAAAFTWILLAGFLVVPGTFTSFKNSAAFKNADNADSHDVESAIVHSIAHVGLLWVSGAFCIVGGLGCLFLWFRWRHNYVWLLNRIFFPAALNAAAGLLTTVVNVYTAQQGVWSTSAIISGSVTGGLMSVAGGLFALYNFWALEKVRDTHEREWDPAAYEQKKNKKNRESVIEKAKRKAQAPALEPGSVV